MNITTVAAHAFWAAVIAIIATFHATTAPVIPPMSGASGLISTNRASIAVVNSIKPTFIIGVRTVIKAANANPTTFNAGSSTEAMPWATCKTAGSTLVTKVSTNLPKVGITTVARKSAIFSNTGLRSWAILVTSSPTNGKTFWMMNSPNCTSAGKILVFMVSAKESITTPKVFFRKSETFCTGTVKSTPNTLPTSNTACLMALNAPGKPPVRRPSSTLNAMWRGDKTATIFRTGSTKPSSTGFISSNFCFKALITGSVLSLIPFQFVAHAPAKVVTANKIMVKGFDSKPKRVITLPTIGPKIRKPTPTISSPTFIFKRKATIPFGFFFASFANTTILSATQVIILPTVVKTMIIPPKSSFHAPKIWPALTIWPIRVIIEPIKEPMALPTMIAPVATNVRMPWKPPALFRVRPNELPSSLNAGASPIAIPFTRDKTMVADMVIILPRVSNTAAIAPILPVAPLTELPSIAIPTWTGPASALPSMITTSITCRTVGIAFFRVLIRAMVVLAALPPKEAKAFWALGPLINSKSLLASTRSLSYTGLEANSKRLLPNLAIWDITPPNVLLYSSWRFPTLSLLVDKAPVKSVILVFVSPNCWLNFSPSWVVLSNWVWVLPYCFSIWAALSLLSSIFFVVLSISCCVFLRSLECKFLSCSCNLWNSATSPTKPRWLSSCKRLVSTSISVLFFSKPSLLSSANLFWSCPTSSTKLPTPCAER